MEKNWFGWIIQNGDVRHYFREPDRYRVKLK